MKGDKLVGLVVGENDFGYIVKSFGGIKAMITFAEVKENGRKIKQDYKFGSIVKGYVLFKKKD
jgi:ribosomal protein S1